MDNGVLRRLMAWLQIQVGEMKYGEISIVLKIHDKELRHIQKHIQENEIPMPIKGGRNASDQ